MFTIWQVKQKTIFLFSWEVCANESALAPADQKGGLIMDDFNKRLDEFSEQALSETFTEDKQNNYSETLFEKIKHINEHGQEFWYARDLQNALDYTQWRRFNETIERAKTACENSGELVSNHFAEAGKMVSIGSGTERKIADYQLSRYACYLIVQNGDPRKKVIALGQTYFAVKTRQQE